ncbi:MAG: AraC family transcriptional regulator, partial [Pseudomonadales bacterium]
MQEASSNPSTIAAYAFAISATLEQCGVDPVSIFKKCQLPLPTTTDPMLRMTNREVSALFSESVKATGDPSFGLLVGETIHPGNLHALGYALMASTSLRDFAQRLCNYYRIVSQNADIRIEETPDAFLLITAAVEKDICWETHDAFTALMVRFIRFIYGPAFNPIRVELMRPDPGKYRQKYSDYFNCELSFDSPEVIIAIAPDLVDVPLPGASKELAQMHDQTTMQYLKRIERKDIINRVRTIIVEELSSSAITKQQVADKLCMSARSLQMKLAAKDTSFQEILD